MPAHVFQINASNGGVPKTALPMANIHALGLDNDRQKDTQHHGGPDRAVSLYSLEHILALQTEGHPIFPGSTGENLTLTGVDWERLAPGVRVQVGAVLLEVTGYATPCHTIMASFREGDFNRIHQKRHPGWSRVYTRVLQPGHLRVGDAVSLLPG